MFDTPPALPKMKNKIIKNYPAYLYVKKKLHSHKFLNMSNWIQVLFIGFIADFSLDGETFLMCYVFCILGTIVLRLGEDEFKMQTCCFC